MGVGDYRHRPASFMKSKITTVPFDGLGNLHSWTHAEPGIDSPARPRPGHALDKWDQQRATYWKPAAPFKTTLTLDRLERGRSAARFIWKDSVGREFPMFGQWLCDAIKKADLYKGNLNGTWGFAKRGANYSIEFLGP